MKKELVTPFSDRAAIADAINSIANESVGKDGGCGYKEVDKAKVASVDSGATKNRPDNLNADAKHKHSMGNVDGLVSVIEKLTKRIEALEVAGG